MSALPVTPFLLFPGSQHLFRNPELFAASGLQICHFHRTGWVP